MGIISYQTYEQNDQHNLNILTMYLAWGGLTKNGYVKPIFPPTRESIEEAIKTRREKREDIFKACIDFLPSQVRLDLQGFSSMNIFSH